MAYVTKISKDAKIEFAAETAAVDGKKVTIVRELKAAGVETLPVSDGSVPDAAIFLRNSSNERSDKGVSGAVKLLNDGMVASGNPVRFGKRAAAVNGWWHTIIYRAE